MGRRRRRLSDRTSIPMLAVSAFLALLSLGAVLRVYAMPVEARTTEPWYAYTSVVGFDFTAQVTPGKFYPSASVLPNQLVRTKAPVDPPVYRRVLLSRLTDQVQVTIPYRFAGDREADVKGQLRLDGTLVVPGIWEKPYPLGEPKEFDLKGQEIQGTATFSVPVADLLADMEANKADGLGFEPVELIIRPAFDVTVGGLREPVRVSNAPEFKLTIRSTTMDIDDTREAAVERVLAETRIVPLSVPILGQQVSVASLRQVSMISLAVSLAAAGFLIYLRRRTRNPVMQLQKLGPSLITAGSFDLPAGTALADVRSVRELIQLHQQTERPVIRVGNSCYLLDGTTCYRLNLNPLESGDLEIPSPEETLDRLATVTDASEFKLDPWITEVQVRSPRDLLQLHTSTGKTVIRTLKSYHLIEGTVCFTYRIPEPNGHQAKAEPPGSGPREPGAQAPHDAPGTRARREAAASREKEKRVKSENPGD